MGSEIRGTDRQATVGDLSTSSIFDRTTVTAPGDPITTVLTHDVLVAGKTADEQRVAWDFSVYDTPLKEFDILAIDDEVQLSVEANSLYLIELILINIFGSIDFRLSVPEGSVGAISVSNSTSTPIYTSDDEDRAPGSSATSGGEPTFNIFQGRLLTGDVGGSVALHWGINGVPEDDAMELGAGSTLRLTKLN